MHRASQITRFVIALLFTVTGAMAQYFQRNLVSDLSTLAPNTDSNLVNPWGIAHSGTSPWWVANNGTGTSTIYDGEGAARPLVVSIPGPGGTGAGTPTGMVFNGTMDFAASMGNPSHFIFATEDGTVAAWSSGTSAVLTVDNSASMAIYKGITIGRNNGANFIYLANFHSGAIEVYDANWNPVSLGAGAFVDGTLPAGYAPFNVQNINGNIYVAYAQQDADHEDEVAGAGFGYVTVYDAAGNVLSRLEHGDWLNAPWAMVVAPGNFGPMSGQLLVGNFGSGQIAGYDLSSGKFTGLMQSRGRPLGIDGLWGLGFGNDAAAGASNHLYFAAGINDESDGLFGVITVGAGSPL